MNAEPAFERARLIAFLADSLALWRASGEVVAGSAPVIAEIRAQDGTLIWIERASDEGAPFRWFVRWRPAGVAPGGAREQRPRPCTSVVGMLHAVRVALGLRQASTARVVAAPATDTIPERTVVPRD